MSNLVRRLRDPAFGTETSERNLMNQAADEIERLRAELSEYSEEFPLLQNDLGKALLDNERLRVALRAYADEANWLSIPGERVQRVWLEPDSYTRDAYDGFEIARAALSETDI